MQALGPIGRNQEEIAELHARPLIICDHIGLIFLNECGLGFIF